MVCGYRLIFGFVAEMDGTVILTNPKYPIHLHTLNFRVVLHEPLPLFASDKLVHEGGVIAIVHHQLGTGFPA